LDELKLCDCGHVLQLISYVAEIIPDA